MEVTPLPTTQEELYELLKSTTVGGKRFVININEGGQIRSVVLIDAKELSSIEETLSLMEDADEIKRIKNGDLAVHTGDFLSENEIIEEFQKLGHPTNIQRSYAQWHLVIARQVRNTVFCFNFTEIQDLLKFLFNDLLSQHEKLGSRLLADLSGLATVRHGEFRIIYRLDNTQKVLRVIEVQKNPDYQYVEPR